MDSIAQNRSFVKISAAGEDLMGEEENFGVMSKQYKVYGLGFPGTCRLSSRASGYGDAEIVVRIVREESGVCFSGSENGSGFNGLLKS